MSSLHVPTLFARPAILATFDWCLTVKVKVPLTDQIFTVRGTPSLDVGK